MGMEGIYIKEKELILLLAAKGIDWWFGIFSENEAEDAENYTKEQVFHILRSLYQKRYIQWDNHVVRINEPMEAVLHVLKQADYGIILEKKDDSRCCYCWNQNIVIVEKSQLEKAMLRIYLMSIDEFFLLLWEDRFFPLEDSLIEEEDVLPECLDLEKNANLNSSFVLFHSKSGKQLETIKIFVSGLCPFIVLEHRGEKNTQIYKKEQCQSILYKWISRRRK